MALYNTRQQHLGGDVFVNEIKLLKVNAMDPVLAYIHTGIYSYWLYIIS